MNKTIRYAVVGLIALFAGGAFADGVPLITAGPKLSSLPPESKSPSFVKAHPIIVNKNAIIAKVLTVTIDGKEHRFVGAMTAGEKGTPAFGRFDTWSGFEGSGLTRGTLTLTRDVKSGTLLGTITLPPARRFTFDTSKGGVLIEIDPTLGKGMTAAAPPASAPASAPKGL